MVPQQRLSLEEIPGGPVPQTPLGFIALAPRSKRGGGDRRITRPFDLGPEQALRLLPSRALSSCPASTLYPAGVRSLQPRRSSAAKRAKRHSSDQRDNQTAGQAEVRTVHRRARSISAWDTRRKV
jgi:hypothetical protein